MSMSTPALPHSFFYGREMGPLYQGVNTAEMSPRTAAFPAFSYFRKSKIVVLHPLHIPPHGYRPRRTTSFCRPASKIA